MRKKLPAVAVPLVLCPLALAAPRASAAPARFDGSSWWAHVGALANDRMEGRDTGSPGLRRAEEYIVEQLKKSGLEPAGENGSFYQPVKLRSRELDERDSSVTLVRDGREQPVALGRDAILSTRVDLAPEVEAPLVFVGYGLRVPEKGYDDLAGLDLKGKLAVLVSGSPSEIPGPLAAHYQTNEERWKTFRDAGLVGWIVIPNPASMDIPWSRIALNRNRPSMALADPAFDETRGVKLGMMWNPAAADELFAGSGHGWGEIAPLARERRPLPRFPLAATVHARTRVQTTPVESADVVAVLPGSDAAKKREYVVLSAHADHIGIGEPIDGDRIYNGAMDNASGCAVLLDIAASLARSGERPARSLLFVFVTGEEKGLLGSRYFAQHPTVPASAIVADVNVDMFLPIVPLHLLTVWGLDESDLGELARQAAAQYGVRVQDDPEPQRNIFIRSDQYNFIRRGIPSLMMGIAADPASPGEQKVMKDWLTHRYHAPSDDLQQPVDRASAARYEDVLRALVLRIADDPSRPRWKPDSFFRRYGRGSGVSSSASRR